MKYTDPDGRSPYVWFDESNYWNGYFEGYFDGISAGFQDMFGQIGNFFQNIFRGKGEISGYGSISLTLGPLSISGTINVDKKGITFEFDNIDDNALTAIQSALGSPVTFDDKSVEASISVAKIGIKKVDAEVSAKIKIERDEKSNSMSISFGPGAKAEILKAFEIEISAGLKISADTNNGDFATIINRKSSELNRKVSNYNYKLSSDWAMDNLYEYY